ncbi:hypothetical protein, partial [Blautia wexlerae]|uniref:hypothetical protein n=1 Tax=Blautia wexlerae TaxID=418240 RepID=UPI0034A23536
AFIIVENICCQGSVFGYEFYFRSKVLRLLKSSRGFFLSYLKIKRLTYIQIGSEVVAKEYPDKVMHLRKLQV